MDLGPDVEIDTAVAAQILGCSKRKVQSLCDMGVLMERRDWRRLVDGGRYHLRRRSVVLFREGLLQTPPRH